MKRAKAVRCLVVLIIAALLSFACRDRSPVARVRVRERVVLLRNGFCSPITLDWDLLRPLDKQRGRAIVFLHLLDRPNHVPRTFDHPLRMAWTAPSRRTYRIDLCQSMLAPALPEGHYTLSM